MVRRRVVRRLRRRGVEAMRPRGDFGGGLFDRCGPGTVLHGGFRPRVGRGGLRRIVGRGRRRAERARAGVIDDLARAGRGVFRQNLAEALVETVDALGQPLALGIAIVVEIGVSLGWVVGAFGDDVVEPFPDRHTRAARGLPGAPPPDMKPVDALSEKPGPIDAPKPLDQTQNG